MEVQRLGRRARARAVLARGRARQRPQLAAGQRWLAAGRVGRALWGLERGHVGRLGLDELRLALLEERGLARDARVLERGGVRERGRRARARDGGLLLERRRARGLRGALRDRARELLPAAAEEPLQVRVEVRLELRERGVDLVLVRGEEGPELRLLEPRGARGLGKREVEEVEGLERVIER